MFNVTGNARISASFANGSGGIFTVDGPKVDSNSLAAGAGISLQFCPSLFCRLSYQADANSDYLIASTMGLFTYKF